MNRRVLWAVLAIGLVLVIAPFAISLPGKAAAGQRMLDGFRPIMQPDQVQITANYYNDVFTPLGKLAPMMGKMNIAGLEPYVGVMRRIPAGLAHYKPLVTTMQANVDNYRQVDSLPDFRLFTWFFVVPGALLILLAGGGLFGGRRSVRVTFHHRPRATHA